MDTPDPGKIRLGPNSILRERYRLDSEIGRGGMGIVYRATDLDLKRTVAVKILPERVSSADARERFIREARAAAALNHPNIVAVRLIVCGLRALNLTCKSKARSFGECPHHSS